MTVTPGRRPTSVPGGRTRSPVPGPTVAAAARIISCAALSPANTGPSTRRPVEHSFGPIALNPHGSSSTSPAYWVSRTSSRRLNVD